VFRKGTDRDAEAYSAFAGKLGDIGLDDYFRAEGVDQVFVAGLALDFCVRQTALDAFGLGYHTTVLADATRPVTYLGGVLTGANFGRYQGNGLEVDTVEAVLEP
jgi:nicotinamidase/pyrazinamidase